MMKNLLQTLSKDKQRHVEDFFRGQLHVLNLKNANLTDASLSLLQAAPVNRLKNVDLSSNPHLTKLPNGARFSALECLKLSGCTGFSNATLAIIFSSYPGLISLSLACCELTALPECLSESTCILEHLDLRANRLCDLPASIASLKCIRELILSGNSLGDRAMVILTNAFTTSSTQLENLYMANNYITSRGAQRDLL